MSASATETLVRNLLAIDYDALPAAVIETARQVAVDGLACALAGSAEARGAGRICIEYVREMGGAAQASVIGGGFKTSMQNAAYANGTMMHALLFDNSINPPMHPTSPSLPVILAIAEHRKLSGKRIVEALVAAIEAQIRVRTASTGLAVGRGWHTPGITGIFGAATAAAKLLDLSVEQACMAFGLAGSRASGLAVNTGTMTKPSHPGHAARMGVECGVLAKMGWTASADVFGAKGYFDTFMGGIAQLDALSAGFGTEPLRMLSSGVGFKAFPCNYFTHRLIDAALMLRAAHDIRAADIERVEIVFPDFEYVNRPQPASGPEGRFSAQYTTLLALLDGGVTLDSFTNERLAAPDVCALLPKVAFRVDKSIPFDKLTMHVVVSVWLKDGRMVSQRVDKLIGWPGKDGKPLNREQRVQKFRSCASRVASADVVNRMLELAEHIDELPDVAELMSLARGAAA